MHQYQQDQQKINENYHLSLNTKEKTTTFEIHVLTCDRHKCVAGLNRWMGFQPYVCYSRGRRDRMVVRFTTTCAFSAYRSC